MKIMFHKINHKLNFIWGGLVFSLIYWILESIRDVFIFEKGTLTERLFFPDIMSVLMRLLVICILILYSAYTESVKRRSEEKEFISSKKLKKYGVIEIGIVFGALYWLLESFRDAFIFRKGTFFSQALSPDQMSIWTRMVAIGIIVLFSLYVQNILNERNKAEKNLRESNLKLKELDRLKSEFLSIVSHELRTPISVIREGIALTMEKKLGDLSATQHKLLVQALNNIDRLTRLVDDLLDISKIEVGKIKIQKSIVDICEIVRQVTDEYSHEAKNKKIQIDVSLPSSPLKIYVDGDKVIQIMNNLLSNAVRFTPSDGKITVCLKDKGEFVQCSIADTGIGIAKENIPRLFSKFQQFGRVEGPGYHGTGLGLAISKALVEKHEGKIWAHSQINKGTTFFFNLKKSKSPILLVVDDEQKIIDMVKEFFIEEDYQMEEAHNGFDAIEKVLTGKYSLLILDMMMPQMSGYEVIGYYSYPYHEWISC
jgi:signal transduction histidine kinase